MLHLAKYAQEDMLELNQVGWLKEGFGPPYRYLSANVDTGQLEDWRTVWYMTWVEYMRGDINNVYSMLEGKNSALKSGGDGNRTYPS